MKEAGKLGVVHAIDWGSEMEIISCHIEVDGNVSKVYPSSGYPVVLMQFTGLLDKIGKEIYEGDLINCPPWFGDDDKRFGGIAEVVFDDGAFIASTERTSGGIFYYHDGERFSWDDCEIIGNIYENPNLLANPLPTESKN